MAGSVLIGRTAELGRLDAALDRAGHGQPQVLLVSGEAGVGKTRLPVPDAPGLAVAAPLRLRTWPQDPPVEGSGEPPRLPFCPPFPLRFPIFPGQRPLSVVA
jgi:hypothetical protein